MRMPVSWAMGMLSLAAVMTGVYAAENQNHTVQQSVNADPRGSVEISNVSGSVDVLGWDRPQVAATAQLHGESLQLVVTAGSASTQVSIGGYPQSLFRFFSGDHPASLDTEAYLTVHVPRQSAITVNAVSASIRTSGVRGAQRLRSVSAPINADLVGAAVDAHTISGTIDLRGGGQSARVAASSVSGAIRLINGSGDLQARSVSGTVQAALSPAHQVSIDTTSGSIVLTGTLAPDATLDAHSISGSVRIATQAAAGFSYEVRSFSGDLVDCFGAQAQAEDRFGPGRSLSGTRGAGGAKIHVQTLSGAVSLCDH